MSFLPCNLVHQLCNKHVHNFPIHHSPSLGFVYFFCLKLLSEVSALSSRATSAEWISKKYLLITWIFLLFITCIFCNLMISRFKQMSILCNPMLPLPWDSSYFYSHSLIFIINGLYFTSIMASLSCQLDYICNKLHYRNGWHASVLDPETESHRPLVQTLGRKTHL